MTPKPLKQLVIEAVPWKWEIVVLHGGTVKQIAAFVRAQGYTDAVITEHDAGRAWLGPGCPAIIWVESIRNMPCLVHEILHTVFGILESRGLKLGMKSEEAYTYTVSDLLTKILNAKKWSTV